ncbi:hypothetical protein N0Z47_20320, partial [Acinetobacter baumannii]
TLMQQAAELAQLFCETFRVVTVALVAMIVERRSDFGNCINARADLLGQLEPASFAKRFGLTDILLTKF